MRRRRPHENSEPPSTACRSAAGRRCSAGIEANGIIVGAYTDRRGGVCPMLAAHRNGGRTSLASFAKAWDRYTGASGRPGPPRDRELNTLRAMLEASIAIDEGIDLSSVRAHRGPEPADTGERHRAASSAAAAGSWRGSGRSGADDYERALAELEAVERERERELVELRLGVSPGRMNWISGTMQRVEVLQQEAHRLGDVLGLDHLLLRTCPRPSRSSRCPRTRGTAR